MIFDDLYWISTKVILKQLKNNKFYQKSSKRYSIYFKTFKIINKINEKHPTILKNIKNNISLIVYEFPMQFSWIDINFNDFIYFFEYFEYF